jgi:hypothetical protein
LRLWKEILRHKPVKLRYQHATAVVLRETVVNIFGRMQSVSAPEGKEMCSDKSFQENHYLMMIFLRTHYSYSQAPQRAGDFKSRG